jgi:hypothetical protein
MRLHPRLPLLVVALLALALASSVASANGREDRPDKPAKPDKPVKPDKPAKADRPEPPGKAKEPGTPAAPHAPKPGDPPGQTRAKEGHPLHPLGGPPGQLKEPGTPASPGHTALGATVAAAPTAGTVLVQAPGASGWAVLEAGAPLPLGSSVDATQGLVEIGSEAAGGVEQAAVVTGAVFQVRQDATEGVTDLVLQGGDFSDCATPAARRRAVTARAAAARRTKGRVARGLWAAGKGRFRTRGRYGSATVRGTRWATVDRCNSTTVKVFDGVVDVWDAGLGRTVTVRAGGRHVATAPAGARR